MRWSGSVSSRMIAWTLGTWSQSRILGIYKSWHQCQQGQQVTSSDWWDNLDTFWFCFRCSDNLSKKSVIMMNETMNTTFGVRPPLTYGKQFYESTRILTGLYLYPILCIAGIFGSCVNFIVYKQSKKYSTNIYLIALSLSDLLKLLNDFMYFIVNLFMEIDGSMGEILFHKIYSYTHYVFVFSGLNTSWLTCAIAFDRYIMICGHHIRNKPFSNIQSISTILLIVLVNSILSVPSPLFFDTVQTIDPNTNRTTYKLENTMLGESMFRTFYQYASGLLRALLPFFILIYLNTQIILFVYKNKYKKTNNQGQLRSKSKSRSTYMLITIVIVFIVCILPDAIMTLMQFGYATENYIVRGLREITDLFLLFNSSSTFPICFYFSIDYRTKFKNLLTSNTSKSASQSAHTNNADVLTITRKTYVNSRNNDPNTGYNMLEREIN